MYLLNLTIFNENQMKSKNHYNYYHSFLMNLKIINFFISTIFNKNQIKSKNHYYYYLFFLMNLQIINFFIYQYYYYYYYYSFLMNLKIINFFNFTIFNKNHIKSKNHYYYYLFLMNFKIINFFIYQDLSFFLFFELLVNFYLYYPKQLKRIFFQLYHFQDFLFIKIHHMYLSNFLIFYIKDVSC